MKLSAFWPLLAIGIIVVWALIDATRTVQQRAERRARSEARRKAEAARHGSST